MKIGRNEPCWCRSGLKYKKCHLDREAQPRLSLSDGLAALKSTEMHAICNCPEPYRFQCSGNPIVSHTLAKSLGLKNLTIKGHVLGLKHDFKTLKRTKGKAEIGPISINKVSVFPGFCSYHDTALFQSVENNSFHHTTEQCALLSYRAIARERYTKMSGIDVNKFLKGADRGRSISQQIAIQKFLDSYGTGLSLARRDLDRALADHHEAIIENDFSRFQSLVFKLHNFPVLCTTGHMPSDNWHGNIVQDLTDIKLEADWLTAASFYSAGHSWIVFTWLRTANKIAEFVNSLIEAYPNRLSDALVKYFFSISENIVVNQNWWLGLDNAQKLALNSRITDGLPIGGGINITAPKDGEPIVCESPTLAIISV